MAETPSYRALLDDAARLLYANSDSPRIDAEVLMQHVLGKPLSWLIAYGDTYATAEHIHKFTQLIDQRQQGQPIAYLIGRKEFWSLQLIVNPQVLIPRADTETLVEHALQLVANHRAPSILDLGTGSGAIALALARERPDANVTGIDASKDALNVAAQNAALNKIRNVNFNQGSWYANLGQEHFNLIAANPPYVAPDDPHLQQGDLRFEPQQALSASEQGFADLNEIIQQAPKFLSKDGALIVEHGHQQAERVGKLFEAAGFADIALHQDLNKLPRCTSGRLRPAQ